MVSIKDFKPQYDDFYSLSARNEIYKLKELLAIYERGMRDAIADKKAIEEFYRQKLAQERAATIVFFDKIKKLEEVIAKQDKEEFLAMEIDFNNRQKELGRKIRLSEGE